MMMSIISIIFIIATLFQHTQSQTTTKCLVRWDIIADTTTATGLSIDGEVATSGIEGIISTADYAVTQDGASLKKTTQFPIYGAVYSSFTPSGGSTCDGAAFAAALPTMSTLTLEDAQPATAGVLNANFGLTVPQIRLPASVGLKVMTKGIVSAAVATSRILSLGLGLSGSVQTFTTTSTNKYSFTTPESTVQMRTKSGVVTVNAIVGDPTELAFADQKTTRVVLTGTVTYDPMLQEMSMIVSNLQVKLTDDLTIQGKVKLRASGRASCTETCTMHGKCIHGTDTSSSTCECECGWTGTNCDTPPAVAIPISASAVVPPKIPTSGGRINVMFPPSTNPSLLTSGTLMVGYTKVTGTPAILGNAGSSLVLSALANPSNGKQPNYWTQVYLASTSDYWCHLPSPPVGQLLKYYPKSQINKLYGSCGDGTTPTLGDITNSMQVSDKIERGVCGSGIVCAGKGLATSSPCKCDCTGTDGWEGFDCGLCNARNRTEQFQRKQSGAPNASLSMCSDVMQNDVDKIASYCDVDMGYRPSHDLNFYCRPGPSLVNLTGPDLTVKVGCGGSSGVGTCNVDVYYHAASTYTTGPRRVLGCTADSCRAEDVTVRNIIDEKGVNVSSISTQTVVCEEAMCSCTPGTPECGETLRSVLKQVTGPFELSCSAGVDGERSFACVVDEKHLPIKIDLTCSAGTCRTDRPPDLLVSARGDIFKLSTGAIVAIAVSLAIAACLMLACAQASGMDWRKNGRECKVYAKGQGEKERTISGQTESARDIEMSSVVSNATASSISATTAAIAAASATSTILRKRRQRDRNRSMDGYLHFNNIQYEVSSKTSCFDLNKDHPTPILRGVAGSIRQGGLTAIMGRSGAGKTSLLRVLTSACRSSSSKNTTANHVNNLPMPTGFASGTFHGPWPRAAHACPFVAQDKDSEIMGSLTVMEQVSYSALLRQPRGGTSGEVNPKALAASAIAALGLDDVSDTRGNVLSGGERRRVSIALEMAALDLRPIEVSSRTSRVLLLDEPCSGLDSALALQITMALSRVAVDHGIAVVMSVHQPSAALWSCVDDLILMSAGRCLYVGPAQGSLVRMRLRYERCALRQLYDQMQKSGSISMVEARVILGLPQDVQDVGEIIDGVAQKSETTETISFNTFAETIAVSVHGKTQDAPQDVTRDEAKDETQESQPNDSSSPVVAVKPLCLAALGWPDASVNLGVLNISEPDALLHAAVSDELIAFDDTVRADYYVGREMKIEDIVLALTKMYETVAPDRLLQQNDTVHSLVQHYLITHGSGRIQEELVKVAYTTYGYDLNHGRRHVDFQFDMDHATNGTERSVRVGSRIGWCRSCRILCTRSVLNMARTPGLLRHHFLLALFLGIFLGAVFQGVTADLAGFQNRAGGLFFCLLCFSFMASGAVETFIAERRLFSQELKSGYYTHSVLFVVQVLCDITLLRIVPTLIFAIIFSSMMGLRQGGEHLIVFIGVLLFSNIVCGMMTMMLSILHDSAGPATLTSNLIILLSALFGGLVMNIKNTPDSVAWVRSLSYFYYGFEALLANELVGMTLAFDPGGLEGVEVKGELFLEAINLRSNAIDEDMSMLVLLAFGYGAVAFLALTCCVPERLTCNRIVHRCKMCCSQQ